MAIALGPLAAEVAQELAPLLAQDEENGGAGAHFVAVLCSPIEVVAEAVREDEDGRDGFAVFMDLEDCPASALPWLLQFKGVRATPGLSEAQAREEGRTAEGLHRGSVPSMVKAAARHLTGTKTVRVLDRAGGDPYATTVITRTSETPDPAVTLADILSDKIIGEIITHIVSDAPIIDEFTLDIDSLAEDIDDVTLGGVT